MKKILVTAVSLTLAVPALAAQQDIAQISAVTASREELRTAVNMQLSAVQANFDEIYTAVGTRPWVIQATAPADTTLAWFDTDQVVDAVVLKIHNGERWMPQAIGEGGSYTLPTAAADTLGGVKVGARLTITDGVLSADVQTGGGDDLGSAAYTDVVALWTTCTGYLKSDGTCDTPSGSADNPIPDGTANGQMLIWATADWTAATGLAFDNAEGDLTVPGTITAASFQTTAANGAIYAEAPNTTAMTAAATLGRLAFVDTGSGFANEKWRLADGTDWDEYLLDSRMIGGVVQAYDADLDTWAGVTPGTGVATALGNAVNTSGGVLTTAITSGSVVGTSDTQTLTNKSLAGASYPTGGSAIQETGNINIDGVSADHYHFQNGSSTATYTPVITSPPAAGQERYILLTVGGGSGVITMTWTNVAWIGAAGAATTTASKYSHYGCIIRNTGNALCKIVAEGADN